MTDFRTEMKSLVADFLSIGESATYTGSNGTKNITVIPVLEEYDVINPQTSEIETTRPQAWIKTEDVPGIKYGDTLTIGSTTYKIIGVREDGDMGFTIVELSKD